MAENPRDSFEFESVTTFASEFNCGRDNSPAFTEVMDGGGEGDNTAVFVECSNSRNIDSRVGAMCDRRHLSIKTNLLNPIMPQVSPPPSYEEASKVSRLAYVDFSPKCTSEGRILTAPKFERLDTLVARANVWLRRHPAVSATCLETIEFDTDTIKYGRSVDTSAITQHEYHHGAFCVRVLRMWIVPRSPCDTPPTQQQLGYLSVLPACIDPGGVSHRPDFETLDVTLDKLNAILARKPLPGNILSIECREMKFRQHSRWLDADRLHYRDRQETPDCRILGLYIFYETGTSTPVEIGFKDFVPRMSWEPTGSGGGVSAKWSTLTQLVEQASAWLADNISLCLTNMQTLQCKAKRTSGPGGTSWCINSNKTLTVSYRSPSHLQQLRVWFVKQPGRAGFFGKNPGVFQPGSDPAWCSGSGVPTGLFGPQLVRCRTFCPRIQDVRSVFEQLEYENLNDVRTRIARWLMNNTSIQVISAETACATVDANGTIDDSTFIPSSVKHSLSVIRVLKVYYTGPTTPGELAASAVPESPDIQSETDEPTGCTIM